MGRSRLLSRRQSRSRRRSKDPLLGIEDEDRSRHPVGLRFDDTDQRGERVRKRRARGDHLERAVNAGREPLTHALFGHVAARSDETHELALGPEVRLAEGIEIADRSVGTHDALRITERRLRGDRPFDGTTHAIAILGMEPAEERLERDLAALRLEPVDSVELVGPDHDVGLEAPFPASDVRNLLGDGELSFDAQRALANQSVLERALGDRWVCRARPAVQAVLDAHRYPIVRETPVDG
jgi:hypothetical protein